jgi:hypothetical protein
MTSDLGIVYATTEMQNRLREANRIRSARDVARAARPATPTAKRSRRFGLRTPAARPSRA